MILELIIVEFYQVTKFGNTVSLLGIAKSYLHTGPCA